MFLLRKKIITVQNERMTFRTVNADIKSVGIIFGTWLFPPGVTRRVLCLVVGSLVNVSLIVLVPDSR